MCRTLLRSLSRPPGLGEGEAVIDRTRSVGGSDSTGPRFPSQGITSRTPKGGTLVISPPDPIAHLHSAAHPPPASFRGARWTRNQHCWAHLPPPGAGLRTRIRQPQRTKAWGRLGPLPSSSSLETSQEETDFSWQFKVPEPTSTFLGCRVLQELRGRSAPSLSFLSRPSSAASRFLTSSQFSVNSLHPARLVLTHKLAEAALLIAPIPPASGFLLLLGQSKSGPSANSSGIKNQIL